MVDAVIHLSNNPGQINEDEYFLDHNLTNMREEAAALEMVPNGT